MYYIIATGGVRGKLPGGAAGLARGTPIMFIVSMLIVIIIISSSSSSSSSLVIVIFIIAITMNINHFNNFRLIISLEANEITQ